MSFICLCRILWQPEEDKLGNPVELQLQTLDGGLGTSQQFQEADNQIWVERS